MTAQHIYSQYYYRIIDLETGKYYSGAKWGRDAYPEMFWKEGGYFTSSNTILSLIEKSGSQRFKVVKLVKCKNAYNFETKVLRKINAAEHENFYNEHNNNFGFVPPESVAQGVKTKTKTVLENGLTIAQETARKASETKTKTVLENGLTIAQETARKASGTKSTVEWKENVGAPSIKKTVRNTDYAALVVKRNKTIRIPDETGDTILDKTNKKISQVLGSEEYKKAKYKTCEYCGWHGDPGNFTKWHGKRCKRK